MTSSRVPLGFAQLSFRKDSPAGPSRPTARTRTFVGLLIGGVLLLGVIARLRVQVASPLPSDDPVRWFALGFLEDLAVLALVGAAVLWLTRFASRETVLCALFASVIYCFVLLFVLWTEAILYFGHPPRSADFLIAGKLSFVQYSLDPWVALRLLIFTLLFGVVLAVAVSFSRRGRMAWSTASRLAALGLGALGLSVLPLRVHLGETSRNPAFALAALLRDPPRAHFSTASRWAKPALAETSLRELAPNPASRRFFSDRFPLAYFPRGPSDSSLRLTAGFKPNVVFLVMEGVRAYEVGAYGGTVSRLTPNLDRLAAEGIKFERVMSPGTHTPEGELALWYGLLAIPEGLGLQHPATTLTGLPELLRSAGWKSFLWIHNSDQTFYGEDRFLQPRGFRTIDGRDFNTSDPRTNWGYSDRALVRRTIVALDRLEEPFAAMMLTISNHHPFQVPADAQSLLELKQPEQRGFFRLPGWNQIVGRHTVPMLKTIHYTDEAVGEFFRLSRHRSWFGRTLFVITSDHGLPIAPLDGGLSVHRFSALRHQVPLIFFSPLLPGGRVTPGPASLADVPPTLLGLLGISAPRAGVGSDLLDPQESDPQRPIVSWDDEARRVSLETARRTYHATVLPEASSGERFVDELLVDSVADPEGREDLKTGDPQSLARLRRAAAVYLDMYPWLVASGHSGCPPALGTDQRKRSFPTPQAF